MSETAQAPQPVEWVPDIPHTVKKLPNMRRVIARRLTESKQTVPHIYLAVDIRLDALLARRAALNAALAADGVKLSVNDMLVKALALALVEVPACNVNLVGDKLYSFARADVAVAVSIPGGLVTPIVTDANAKSLAAISSEIKDMAARAQTGGLRPEEYNGGSAALSNMGMFGVRQFDAIINPPHGMILAVGAGEPRVVPIDGRPAVATVMTVTGGFDHRAIDGADGARLMAAVKRIVEDPTGLE
jgi:pyruvate dehydrogenase E2 component (dihydrolipoamide acetyltransferase)